MINFYKLDKKNYQGRTPNQPSSTSSSLPKKGKAVAGGYSNAIDATRKPIREQDSSFSHKESSCSSSSAGYSSARKATRKTLRKQDDFSWYGGGSYSYGRNDYSSYAPSVQIVKGFDKGCCVVDAIAGVTGGNYARAREAAMNHGFDPSYGGMFMTDARDALSELGVDATYHPVQPDSWSQFPRKAIVGVNDGGVPHAVILRGDYIYDNARSRPVHRDYYRREGEYIELK